MLLHFIVAVDSSMSTVEQAPLLFSLEQEQKGHPSCYK